MQNAKSDTRSGDHNKSEKGAIPFVIACLSAAKFLEPIEETLYYIPPFILSSVVQAGAQWNGKLL